MSQILLALAIGLVGFSLVNTSGDCDNPCGCDDHPADGAHKECSDVRKALVTDRTVLSCSCNSYCHRIEYDGCYNLNVSCNAVESYESDSCDGEVYLNCIRKASDGSETVEVLRAEWQKQVTVFNNGHLSWNERAKLTDCECDGDEIASLSTWEPDDTLTGCCDQRGTYHLTANSYVLRIFGRCCSYCWLDTASIYYDKTVQQ